MSAVPRRGRSALAVALAATLATVVVAVAGALMAILGGELACLGGGGTAAAAPATPAAAGEIPPERLRIYRAAGRRFDVEWAFLASIGYQECGHGACARVYPSGCAGPMAIGYVRGSACSPDPSAPTIWERYGIDGGGDGEADVLDPADAVFTAARMMRPVFGLAGRSHGAYRETACNYYGACADSVASYADEVMERAARYGFRGRGGPAPPAASEPVASGGGSACGASVALGAGGNEIVRVARGQLGTAESPPGSNCNPYGPCVQWCSLFVAWVWKRAGVPLEGSTAAYAYSGSIYEWARSREGAPPGLATGGGALSPFSEGSGARALPPTATPAPGDAIFYGSGPTASAHVGIVERVFPGGRITTINGNFGDRVARSGPFAPSAALAYGMPGPVYGYARPPRGAGEGGGDG